MDKVNVIVKDQLDQEYVVTAYLNQLDDEDLSIFKRIDHIVVNDEVILPNVDLLYESQQDEKIYKVSALAEES